MATAAQSSAIVLKFSPGSGFSSTPLRAGSWSIQPCWRRAPYSPSTPRRGGGKRQFQVTVAEILQPAGAATSFETAGALDELSFVATMPPAWTQAAASRAWCRRRWSGHMATGWARGATGSTAAWCASAEGGRRRSTVASRSERVSGWRAGTGRNQGGDLEAADGAGRLHIREYTGSAGTTISLATTAVGWTYDAWHWLEVDVADAPSGGGSTPRARQRRTGR